MKCCAIASNSARECAALCKDPHWQASQPGSSMAQNLTSVAGTAAICACAAEAVASMALMPLPGAPDADTALCEPELTVDFSTCVALEVRR